MNKVFNFLWFCIVKWIIPVGVGGTNISNNHLRMFVQFYLARIFGGPKGVILGDSNGAVLNTFRTMRKFDRVVINWSVGGTVAHDWVDYFKTNKGKKMKARMQRAQVIFNIGGNYILLGQMSMAKPGLSDLHALFPDSWNCTVSPVNTAILAALSKLAGYPQRNESYYNIRVPLLNEFIFEIWKRNVIDVYKIFGDKYGKALPGVLKDPVHFSEQAVYVIQKIFELIV